MLALLLQENGSSENVSGVGPNISKQLPRWRREPYNHASGRALRLTLVCGDGPLLAAVPTIRAKSDPHGRWESRRAERITSPSNHPARAESAGLPCLNSVKTTSARPRLNRATRTHPCVWLLRLSDKIGHGSGGNWAVRGRQPEKCDGLASASRFSFPNREV